MCGTVTWLCMIVFFRFNVILLFGSHYGSNSKVLSGDLARLGPENVNVTQ